MQHVYFILLGLLLQLECPSRSVCWSRSWALQKRLNDWDAVLGLTCVGPRKHVVGGIKVDQIHSPPWGGLFSKLFDHLLLLSQFWWFAFSALTLLLGVTKSFRPVRDWVMRYWMQMMPLPTYRLFLHWSPEGFTVLVPAYSPCGIKGGGVA